MKSHGLAHRILFVFTIALLASGCRSDVVFAANLAVGAIPCVLMYMVLNLKRDR